MLADRIQSQSEARQARERLAGQNRTLGPLLAASMGPGTTDANLRKRLKLFVTLYAVIKTAASAATSFYTQLARVLPVNFTYIVRATSAHPLTGPMLTGQRITSRDVLGGTLNVEGAQSARPNALSRAAHTILGAGGPMRDHLRNAMLTNTFSECVGNLRSMKAALENPDTGPLADTVRQLFAALEDLSPMLYNAVEGRMLGNVLQPTDWPRGSVINYETGPTQPEPSLPESSSLPRRDGGLTTPDGGFGGPIFSSSTEGPDAFPVPDIFDAPGGDGGYEEPLPGAGEEDNMAEKLRLLKQMAQALGIGIPQLIIFLRAAYTLWILLTRRGSGASVSQAEGRAVVDELNSLGRIATDEYVGATPIGRLPATDPVDVVWRR